MEDTETQKMIKCVVQGHRAWIQILFLSYAKAHSLLIPPHCIHRQSTVCGLMGNEMGK